MNVKILYLTGFMGAGKSTIGPILANTLGWGFYDLDSIIEDKTGKKISEIFETLGEEHFRKIENETLKEVSNGEKLIISLGGGTIINQANLDLIKNRGKIIYLKASAESIYKRLQFKRDRPILKIDDDADIPEVKLLERLRSLLNKRKSFYEQADIIIDTDVISVGKTVDIIAKMAMKENQ